MTMASTASARKSTKRNPRSNGRRQPSPDNWEEWIEHLGKRRNRPSLTELIPANRCAPLRWAMPNETIGEETEALLVRLERLTAKSRSASRQLATTLGEWLDEATGRDADPATALEAVAWAHSLPVLAHLLPAAPWSELLDQLTEMAADSAAIDEAKHPLAYQLLAGELPWTLAYQLPEIKSCASLAGGAREVLTKGPAELLDGEGLVHGRHLSLLRPLLACWTRCYYLGRASRSRCFNDDSQNQFNWLFHQALRLTRHDGRQVLTEGTAGAWSPSLFEAALLLADDKEDNAIASIALPRSATKSKTATRTTKLPSAAVHSEWSQLGVLRRDWDRDSDHLAIAYGDGQLLGELNCGNVTVFSGDICPELSIDGKPADFGEWTEVCWETDDDVDYLELQCKFSDRLRVQRQMLLARKDRFLFVADAVLGQDQAQLEHRITLPLCNEVKFHAADETTEGHLNGKRRLGAVIPLSLPEWRSDVSDSQLSMESGGLALHSKANAARLYAPLFIDLDPKRSQRALTWRRLTVASDLEVVANDVAVGYRVQIGKQQWLFYRSLAEIGNRTLLGQNYSTEFVAARFPVGGGEADKLLDIEL